MFVIDDGLLNWLQTPNNHILYLTECLWNLLLAILWHQEELHTSKIPLASKSFIIVFWSFLNGNISQMDVMILNVFNVVCVSVMSESSKPCSVEISCQWRIASDEAIDSHIEFLATDEQRIHDVPRHDVGLSLRTLRLPSEVILPFGNLLKLVEQEYTLSLRLCYRFHDPYTANVLFEFLYKQWIVSRQIVCCWEKVVPIQMIIMLEFLTLEHLQIYLPSLTVSCTFWDFLPSGPSLSIHSDSCSDWPFGEVADENDLKFRICCLSQPIGDPSLHYKNNN